MPITINELEVLVESTETPDPVAGRPVEPPPPTWSDLAHAMSRIEARRDRVRAH